MVRDALGVVVFGGLCAWCMLVCGVVLYGPSLASRVLWTLRGWVCQYRVIAKVAAAVSSHAVRTYDSDSYSDPQTNKVPEYVFWGTSFLALCSRSGGRAHRACSSDSPGQGWRRTQV